MEERADDRGGHVGRYIVCQDVAEPLQCRRVLAVWPDRSINIVVLAIPKDLPHLRNPLRRVTLLSPVDPHDVDVVPEHRLVLHEVDHRRVTIRGDDLRPVEPFRIHRVAQLRKVAVVPGSRAKALLVPHAGIVKRYVKLVPDLLHVDGVVFCANLVHERAVRSGVRRGPRGGRPAQAVRRDVSVLRPATTRAQT